MTKPEKTELLIVGGAIVAFAALGFMAGILFSSKKKQQLIVTPKGELKEVEIED